MNLSKNILDKNNIELIDDAELFKSLPEFSRYYISNFGRLIHKSNKGKHSIVNPSIVTGGYLAYTLNKPARKYKGKIVRDADGNPKSIRVTTTANRLVAFMFCENPYEKEYEYQAEQLDAHHKNHIRIDNYFENLMILSNGKGGSRADHAKVNSIKKIAIYDTEKGKYNTYRDMEFLCRKLNLSILDLIDKLREPELFKDGLWSIYEVAGETIGVQYYKRKRKTKKNKTRKNKGK